MIEEKLYGGRITLQFDERKHRFTVNGRPVPFSVTGCTGVIDKPALKYWAANLSRDFLLANLDTLVNSRSEDEITALVREAALQHTRYTKKAADIGTQIHKWAEAFIKAKTKKDIPPLPDDPLVHNGVTAFLKWVDEEKVKFVSSERMIYSKRYGYAGIMDAEAVVRRRLRVVDFKTSNAIYPEMRYQTAAYQKASEEESGKPYSGHRIIVRFGKTDGEFDAVECKEVDEDYEVFLACLTIKQRTVELKP